MSPVKSSALVRDPIPATPARTLTFVPKVTPAKKAAPIPTGYYKRPGGDVWYFRRKIDGVLINVSTGFTDIQDARRRGAELEHAQRYGDRGWETKEMPTLQQHFDQGKAHVSPRVADFVKEFGKLRLNRIDSETCRLYIALRLKAHTKYGRPFTPGTVRVECAILKAWFQRVVGTKKLLRENPWKGVTLPKKSVKKRYLRQGDEETRLFDVLTTFDDEIVRAVKVLIGSGLRIAEFRGLRPRDVQNGVIAVRKECAKGGVARNVPVHPTVLVEIEAQRVARGLEAFATEPLFALPAFNLAQRLKRACRLAGIELITPHDLRRTYGTRMAFKVPAKVLQLLMGHRQISTTFEHYNVAEEHALGSLVADAGSIL